MFNGHLRAYRHLMSFETHIAEARVEMRQLRSRLDDTRRETCLQTGLTINDLPEEHQIADDALAELDESDVWRIAGGAARLQESRRLAYSRGARLLGQEHRDIHMERRQTASRMEALDRLAEDMDARGEEAVIGEWDSWLVRHLDFCREAVAAAVSALDRLAHDEQ